jgi:hypothetical protein
LNKEADLFGLRVWRLRAIPGWDGGINLVRVSPFELRQIRSWIRRQPKGQWRISSPFWFYCDDTCATINEVSVWYRGEADIGALHQLIASLPVREHVIITGSLLPTFLTRHFRGLNHALFKIGNDAALSVQNAPDISTTLAIAALSRT